MIRRLGKKKAEALALAGKPWPRSSITASRKAPRKHKRKPSETLRIYGTPARRKFVRSLPCAACGVWGYSVQAHVLGNGGTGRKADADTIAPLCCDHWAVDDHLTLGCHFLFDEMPWEFNTRFPDFNSEQAARQTEIAYQNHLKGETQ